VTLLVHCLRRLLASLCLQPRGPEGNQSRSFWLRKKRPLTTWDSMPVSRRSIRSRRGWGLCPESANPNRWKTSS